MRRLAGMVMAGGFVLAGWSPPARTDDTHVGWIAQISDKCDGKWRAKDGGEAKRLDVVKDRFRFLYPGEAVRCDGNGSMDLQVLDNPVKTITRKNGWCTIHNDAARCEKEEGSEPRPAGASTKISVEDERALKGFGRAAGRQRGFRSAIFSPAAESTIRASWMTLRWNEIAGVPRITLRLTDKYHAVLWEQVDVDASAGQLAPIAARSALAQYREKGGAGPFSLILVKAGEEESPVNFSILSSQEECEVDQDLGRCEGKRARLRSACRVYAFSSRGMWNDAAEEYEAALKLEPESVDLQVAALVAERGIGNEKRVADLQAKLPPGTAVPQ